MKKSNEGREKQSLKSAFSTRASKAGSVSLVTMAIVLVITVVFNLLVSALPAKYTSFDLTSGKTFSTGKETAGVLNSLKKDVTLYYICKAGSEDNSIRNLLNDYSSFKKVTVKNVDPVVSPMFTKNYTEEELADNSVIAVCGNNSKIVSADDMYEKELDYSSYSYRETGFCAENKITNAIAFVCSGKTFSLGLLSGHGESEPDSAMTAALTDAGYNTEEINLKSTAKIDSALTAVMIISPKSDITPEEYGTLSDYVNNGGKIFAATDTVDKDKMPQLVKFLRDCGIELADGVVFETDKSKCYQSYYYLLPDKADHDITSGLEKYYILFPIAQGFTVSSELPEGTETVPLLSTSKNAYSAVNYKEKTSVEMGKDDIKSDNGFSLGAVVSISKNGVQKPGKVVYYSSSTFMNSDVDSAVSGANSSLVVKSINWLNDEDSTSVSIPVKELKNETLTINEGVVSVLELILLFTLPAIFIAAGIVILIVRRKK